MFDYLKRILLPENLNNINDNKNGAKDDKKLQVATCIIFIEMAKADNNFTNKERSKIISIMESTFSLNEEYVQNLMDFAEKKADESYGIYEYTSIINDSFNNDEKFELIKNLWRLIYTDKKLDVYEDHLVKKIGGLLNIEHQLIIGAKLMVKEELKK